MPAPDAATRAILLALAGSGALQAVLLALRMRRNAGSAAFLAMAGILCVASGAVLTLMRATLHEWIGGGFAPLLFMAGFALAAAAPGAAAEGVGGVQGRGRKTPFLRTMLGVALAAWAIRGVAGSVSAAAALAGYAEEGLVAAVAGLACLAVLRAGGKATALKIGSGIIAGAASAAALAALAADIAGRGAWFGADATLRMGAAFLLAQHLAFDTLLLAKENADELHFAAATHDTLTGLLNRNGFSEAVGKSLSMCARQNTPYTVVQLDIQDFKAINAAQGHAAGDRVLLDFAARIHSRIRPYDHFCRMGADRFYLFLQTVDRRLAPAVLGRLVAQIGLASGDVPAYRISGGAACVDCPSGQNIVLDDLFIACDGALREARRKGGSRIELAPF